MAAWFLLVDRGCEVNAIYRHGALAVYVIYRQLQVFLNQSRQTLSDAPLLSPYSVTPDTVRCPTLISSHSHYIHPPSFPCACPLFFILRCSSPSRLKSTQSRLVWILWATTKLQHTARQAGTCASRHGFARYPLLPNKSRSTREAFAQPFPVVLKYLPLVIR